VLETLEGSFNVCQVNASCRKFLVDCHLASLPANSFRLLTVQLCNDDLKLSFKGLHRLGKVWILPAFFLFYRCCLRIRGSTVS